jgi:hypothetical protein
METTNKNTELVKRKEIKDTPFTVISLTEQNEHFAVLGDYRVTEVYDNPQTAEKEVKKVTWNRLIQVILILQEKFKDDNFKQTLNS